MIDMKKVTFVVAWLHEKMNLKNFPRCLDSIEQQDGIQKELIVLTDMSEDQSVGNYQHESENFQMIYEDHPGLTLGALRNLGLQKATGDYICFIDPNDFLVEDVMKKATKVMQQHDLDILIGQMMKYDAKTQEYTYKTKNKTFSETLTSIEEKTGLVWDLDLRNKIFKRSFLTQHQLYFSNVTFYDYMAFEMKALSVASRVMVYPIHFYNERVRGGLDKLHYPLLEEAIDSQQVFDMVQVFLSLYQSEATTEFDNFKNEGLIKRYLQFVFKRGLNYLNVVEDQQAIFDELAKPLQLINIEELNEKDRQKTILAWLKTGQLETYLTFLKEEKAEKLKNKSFSKHVKRQLFINLYRWSSQLKIKNKHILFVSHSPGMDGNYSFIKEAIEEYNQTVEPKQRFTYSFTSTKISAFEKLFLPFKLARSEFILVSEYVPFFQLIDFRDETKVVQTWHAAGAFKKFGYSTNYLEGGPNPFKNTKMHIHKGYDYATVSSEEVRRHYAEAFDMPIENVIPVGLPRADFFFDEVAVSQMKEKIYGLYPALKGKQVILYAPTFRGVGKKRAKFKMEFDFNRIAKEISDDYIIALKLHPSVKSSDIEIEEEVAHKVINISEYSDANDILTVTDLLITDYSSIIFDYSLLNKPMLFYAYDLEEYLYDRNFYYEYESFVPGPIARTNEEIIRLIQDNQFDLNQVKTFSETFFVEQAGTASQRFVQDVLVKLSQS